MKKLRWFWLINFDKIVGALAKFQEGLIISDADLGNRTDSVEILRQIDRCLNKLQPRKHFGSIHPRQTPLWEQKYVSQGLIGHVSEAAFAAIERDDASGLDQHLSRSLDQLDMAGHKLQQLLFDLLHYTVVRRSQGCPAGLIRALESLEGFDDQIHWLVIKIGRSTKLYGEHTKFRKEITSAPGNNSVSEIADRLVQDFRQLGSKLEEALEKKDAFGRLPLHYAVQHDLAQVCQEI